jgi:hypothetical protein
VGVAVRARQPRAGSIGVIRRGGAGRRPMSRNPQARAEELERVEDVVAALVVSASQPCGIQKSLDETFDQIAIAIEAPAEREAFAQFVIGRDVGESSVGGVWLQIASPSYALPARRVVALCTAASSPARGAPCP